MEFRKRSCGSIQMSNSGSIMRMPEELIVDILSRLEVKSVLKCRCVCKSWNKITQLKLFLKKHEKRRLKNNCPEIVCIHDILYSSNGEEYVYRDCLNGLVLEVRTPHGKKYRIRNQATKQVLKLKEDKSLFSRRVTAFLGFDSSTGNYKMISFCRKKGIADFGVIMSTLGNDHLSYESLDITLLSFGSKPFLVHHNDVCYALSFCYTEIEKSDIIRFTMDGKSSMNIKLPLDFRKESVPGNGSISELLRQLKMFIIDDDNKLSIGFSYVKELHVWVLEDYNKHLWSHKIIVHLDFFKDYSVPWFYVVHTSPNLDRLRIIIGTDFVELDVQSKKCTYLVKPLTNNVAYYPLTPSLISLKGMCHETITD